MDLHKNAQICTIFCLPEITVNTCTGLVWIELCNCTKNDTFNGQACEATTAIFGVKSDFFYPKAHEKLIAGNFREIAKFFDIAAHI